MGARLSRSDHYLARARNAEIRRDVTKDIVAKTSWDRMVVDYLYLADMARRRDLELFAGLRGARR